MAKKRTTSKPIKRSSTMKNTIKEGQKFLDSTKQKKSKRTRTMAQTIKEGQQLLSRNTRKNNKRDDSRSQSIQPKDDKKKQKKITKKKNQITKKNQIKSHSSKSQDPKPATKKGKTARPTKPAIPSKPASPVDVLNNIKKTIFKTKSKDHLPIPAFGFIDVCFCIDATGSMSGQLGQAQSTILSIINNIENKVQTEGLTLRFAVVSYRDHPPQQSTYVTSALDFTDGFQASNYVKNLTASGGGDAPQAVHDGLLDCCKLNWIQLPGTPILRYIFHIADAQPHGKEFGNLYETKHGCTCGIQTHEIYHAINTKQIHYRLLKARTGTQLNIMQTKFRQNITDFESVALSNAKQMDVRISDMIIHQVIPGDN